jgi:hypothetical protein
MYIQYIYIYLLVYNSVGDIHLHRLDLHSSEWDVLLHVGLSTSLSYPKILS